PPRWRVVGALAAVPLLALLYGVVRIRAVDAQVAAAEKARVGIVQGNMSLLAKRRDRSEGLRRHLLETQKLQKQAPLDLVVWSETSVVNPMSEDRAYRWYTDLFARSLGVPLIFGGVLVRPVSDAREFVWFNSALVTDAQGEVRGR